MLTWLDGPRPDCTSQVIVTLARAVTLNAFFLGTGVTTMSDRLTSRQPVAPKSAAPRIPVPLTIVALWPSLPEIESALATGAIALKWMSGNSTVCCASSGAACGTAIVAPMRSTSMSLRAVTQTPEMAFGVVITRRATRSASCSYWSSAAPMVCFG